MPLVPKHVRYIFGDFELLTGSRTLLRNGSGIGLSPKEFLTLLLLIQAEGQAVGREAMMAAIWPDSVVGDTSLGRNISALRRHLGAETIVSVPRFGYRFTPEVRTQSALAVTVGVPAPLEPLIKPAPRRSSGNARRLGILSFTAVAVIVGVGVFSGHRGRVRAAKAETNSEAAYWEGYGVKALEEGTYFKASKALEHASTLAPKSASIHLNLAEAAFLRDFIETAQKQVLIVETAPEYRELSDTDHLRLDALRALLVQDYATAIERYQTALSGAEEFERFLLLEEAGTAYLRQGNMGKAEKSFVEAARLNPANAGPELALGKLDSLQRRWPEAGHHFDRAEQIFQASSSAEGVAEVDYQRAMVDYVQARYAQEEESLKRSLAVARELSDPELSFRCIGALSTAYRWMNRFDLSRQYAVQETEGAMRAGSIYFYAAGVMAQANLAVALHNREDSKRLLQQAADLAQQTGNARQEANAEFTLADFSGDTGDYAKEIAYANKSMLHYKSYGSADGVADAQLLRVAGERRSGMLSQALADAQDLLHASETTHSDLFVEDTETELGRIYSAMGNEPEALVHFLLSQEWSRRTGSQPALKTLHVAGSYARMGRWKEAKTAWAKVPASTKKDPDCEAEYAQVRDLMKRH